VHSRTYGVDIIIIFGATCGVGFL